MRLTLYYLFSCPQAEHLLLLQPRGEHREWLQNQFMPILEAEAKFHVAMHLPLSHIYELLAQEYAPACLLCVLLI